MKRKRNVILLNPFYLAIWMIVGGALHEFCSISAFARSSQPAEKLKEKVEEKKNKVQEDVQEGTQKLKEKIDEGKQVWDEKKEQLEHEKNKVKEDVKEKAEQTKGFFRRMMEKLANAFRDPQEIKKENKHEK